jgi:hypothetical protein
MVNRTVYNLLIKCLFGELLEEAGDPMEVPIGHGGHMHDGADIKLLDPVILILEAKGRPDLLVFGEDSFVGELHFEESLVIFGVVLPEVQDGSEFSYR